MTPTESLRQLGDELRQEFGDKRRVLSFGDWFRSAAENPRIHVRNAAQYVLDAWDHYERYEVQLPTGATTRWRLFDCPWDEGRERLVGQEGVQRAVYRTIRNFTRTGKVSRLVLLHGPNGSAKSTIVACIQRALEHYSTTDEGALYTFHWVFPSSRIAKKRLGFGDGERRPEALESYAYLDEEDIDAKIPSSLRDHPIYLIPQPRRAALLAEWVERADLGERSFVLSEAVIRGDLEPRSRQIFDALLTAYHGDFERVLQHIQVERVFFSRRYRRGVISVEPQLHVDASLRQVTADRSLESLPSALHNLTLFEPYGDLVDANRGIIEFNDMLEKPLDAYRYLISTCEKSSVALPHHILHLDMVFMATGNERHLLALKDHPYFASLKGRLELVRVPYLLDYAAEQQIYDDMLRSEVVTKTIAPHTTWVAALWAVLSRMKKPRAEIYPASIRDVVGRLSPMDKAELYATGGVPAQLSLEQAKELRALIPDMTSEFEDGPDYEGSDGASPREMKNVLLNAAANDAYPTLSPLAVFDELEELVRDKSVYDFLRREPVGDYYRAKAFSDIVRARYLDRLDDEVRDALGLVSAQQYTGLFQRYVTHVSYARKGEKLLNPVTGQLQEPDQRFMSEMETNFRIGKDARAFRDEVVSRIGAWSIDHRNEPIPYEQLFPQFFEAMRESYYEQQTAALQRRRDEILRLFTDGASALAERERERATEAIDTLKSKYGHTNESAKEALVFLFRHRYA